MFNRPVIGRVGLAAVAALSLAAAPIAASASVFGSNLIVNGDAEAAPGATNDSAIVATPGFTTVGNFTTVSYSAGAGFPVAASPGGSVGGANFFAGGPSNGSSSASQLIDISSGAGLIDLGTSTFSLSAYLGGFASQNDNAVLSIAFLDSLNAVLGSSSIGPVSSADRGAVTGLFFRSASGAVPIGARSVSVFLQMTRQAGSYNDGYADNLSLVLRPGEAPAPGGVPEPATWALMLIGLGAVGAAVRRRRGAAPLTVRA